MELDAEQRKATETLEGPVMIVAPPGSGKTHTLVERIVALIEKKGLPPERIVALTFTTKAALELRERVSQRIHGLPYATTFHSLAQDILRTHGSAIGIASGFKLFEEREAKEKETDLTFDELLEKTVLLLGDATTREHWQNRFDAVVVDEYQDTDGHQDALLRILSERHRNICVIGDPHQSIYGFRGANAQNFPRFKEEFPNARTIELSTNYRSTKPIVAATREMIQNNTGEIGFGEVRTHKQGAASRIVLSRAQSPRAEAHNIAREIESLIGGTYHPEAGDSFEGGRQPGDIAVLYRFHAMGALIEEALLAAGIPSIRVTEKNLDAVEFETFKVTLMTMHAAKGLEFPVVFVAGVEEGVVPFFGYSKETRTPEELVEEERRLLYVAMTRAKELLYLSQANSRMLFGKSAGGASRFLAELPSEYLEERTVKERPKKLQQSLF